MNYLNGNLYVPENRDGQESAEVIVEHTQQCSIEEKQKSSAKVGDYAAQSNDCIKVIIYYFHTSEIIMVVPVNNREWWQVKFHLKCKM